MLSTALAVFLTAHSLLPLAGSSQRAAGNDETRELTLSGCLVRSGYAGYQIEDAHLDAINGKNVAKSGSSTANASFPKKWILDGGGNLAARVGEKVEVIGHSDWAPSAQPDDEAPNRTPHLEVKTVKTLAPNCS
jgi:hypothetical protein